MTVHIKNQKMKTQSCQDIFKFNNNPNAEVANDVNLSSLLFSKDKRGVFNWSCYANISEIVSESY